MITCEPARHYTKKRETRAAAIPSAVTVEYAAAATRQEMVLPRTEAD